MSLARSRRDDHSRVTPFRYAPEDSGHPECHSSFVVGRYVDGSRGSPGAGAGLWGIRALNSHQRTSAADHYAAVQMRLRSFFVRPGLHMSPHHTKTVTTQHSATRAL